MDIKPYVGPIIKWWWLILISILIALGTSYYFLRDQQPVYASTSTLLIGRSLSDPNPTGNDLFLNQQLANLYISMANTEPVQEGARKTLGLDWLPSYEVRPAGGNQFIQLTVTDSDPARAQAVCKELARQLIILSPGGSGHTGDQTRQEFINEQINVVEQQIRDTEEKITELQLLVGTLTSATDLTQAETDQAALETRLVMLRTNYANLVASNQTVVANTLQVLEPATLPVRPVGLPKFALLAIAGLIGLVLSTAAAFLLELLDTSINSPDEIRKTLQMEPVGFIMDMGRSFKEHGYVHHHPNTRLAESFRTLRVNVDYAQQDTANRVIMITSATPGDGKSSVAINLGLTMAKSGRRVILVDGDMRRPALHRYLELKRSPGLAEALEDDNLAVEDLVQPWLDSGMAVLTAGDQVDEDRIDQLLSAGRIEGLITRLLRHTDVLIFDCPPILISDALALSVQADGVLLVIRPGYAQKDMLVNLVTTMRRLGVNFLGVVMNRIRLDRLGLTDTYRYYVPYYYNKYRQTKKVQKSLERAPETADERVAAAGQDLGGAGEMPGEADAASGMADAGDADPVQPVRPIEEMDETPPSLKRARTNRRGQPKM